jgi:predicted solute-binding protein
VTTFDDVDEDRRAYSPDPTTPSCFTAWRAALSTRTASKQGQVLADDQTLNRAAFEAVTKSPPSFHAMRAPRTVCALCTVRAWATVRSGSVARRPIRFLFRKLADLTIAIPGRMTSAYLALQPTIRRSMSS